MLHSNADTLVPVVALALLPAACSPAVIDSEPRFSEELVSASVVRDWTPTPVVTIEGGRYRTFYRDADMPRIQTFRMEIRPVTNEQFRAFVAASPKWRRSRAKRLFVGESYLAHWAGDTDLGEVPPQSAVANVSWFAARAYADWAGRRLPTLAEWEFAAAANASSQSTKSSALGFEDMQKRNWEWVEDFNTTTTGTWRDADVDRRLCGRRPVGSSAARDYTSLMRIALFGSLRASHTIKNLGFRCVVDGEESK